MIILIRVLIALYLLASFNPAEAAILYQIKPEFVHIGFIVDNLFGTFSTSGTFGEFSGNLLLDLDAPEGSRVDVSINSQSVQTGWELADSMLKSDDFLDPDHFPAIRFISDHVNSLGQDHAVMHGHLVIRGISHPQDLDAWIENRSDLEGSGPVADFTVKGLLKRSDYGMSSDYPLVSDVVTLDIRAHILLTPVDTSLESSGAR